MPNSRIYEWFRFADTDLAAAEFLLSMHPQPLELICYHCQQSAEKYLKGYLIHNGIGRPPKTHDLDQLCALCSTIDSSFDVIANMCNSFLHMFQKSLLGRINAFKKSYQNLGRKFFKSDELSAFIRTFRWDSDAYRAMFIKAVSHT